MKCLCNAIVLSSIISALTFQIQSQPGTQKDVQGKKTVPEKSEPSSPPSEKGKLAKQEEAGKLDAPEVAPSISPTSKETLAKAVSLALSIGRQADIDDPIDKIKVMLESAKLLVGVSPNDSRYLMAEAADLLLERKKKEQHEDEQTKIAGIERELIALYSKLDPEKTEKFIKESLDVAEENIRKSQTDNGSQTAKARAEKMAELATALIDSGIPAGVDLLLNSVAETGRVATAFERPFETVAGASELRERMSARIKQAFSGKIIADPVDLSTLAFPVIHVMGKNAACSTINAAILELEINSLKQIEATLRSAREQEQPVPYTNDELDFLFRLFASRLRGSYSKWLPGRLKDVDLSLKGIQESVSFKIGEHEAMEKAESFEEKLDKASHLIDSARRERELINLAFDVMNKHVMDERYSRDQMIDKILNKLNLNDNRELVKDATVIASIKEIVKGKNFAQVVEEARRISRADWRAQALAGAASSMDKTDQEAADRLYMEALGDLNNSKPGTAVIRTTLLIAERYYVKNPAVGRQILDSAIRFANQTNFSEKGVSFPFDRMLFARIGSVIMAVGFEPERIREALRDFGFGKMTQLNWQLMYEISHKIENKMLRATFQLKMCEAVINRSSSGERKVE
jgi:predicted nucleotidyltransferase